MDEVLNPFTPGAGTAPPTLAGREQMLDSFVLSLRRAHAGRQTQPILMTGLRGIGKTALLNQFVRLAAELEATVDLVYLEISDSARLSAQLNRELYTALANMGQAKGIYRELKAGARQALRSGAGMLGGLLRSARWKLAMLLHPGASAISPAEPDLPPVAAPAQSPGPDAPDPTAPDPTAPDLTELLLETARAAQQQDSVLLLIVDEIQQLSPADFDLLISAVHRAFQLGLPVVLTAAGLPSARLLVAEAKAYAERMFQFMELGPLSEEAAGSAICRPLAAHGVQCDEQTLSKLYRMTGGYPYFLQEWGYALWNLVRADAKGGRITDRLLQRAEKDVLAKLDADFFRTRMELLRPTERNYLLAMAGLGAGPHRSGDIAKACGKKVQSVAPVRDSLIRKGVVYSPEHGMTAFSVPLLDAFIRRNSKKTTP